LTCVLVGLIVTAFKKRSTPFEFGTRVEEQAGYRRGIVKDPAEGVEETAQRAKALEWTREAGTARGLWIGGARPDARLQKTHLAARIDETDLAICWNTVFFAYC